MGIKNLTVIDPYSTPEINPEYFIPLSLQLDPEERASFQLCFDTTYKSGVGDKELYSPVPDVKNLFPKTLKQTNDYLRPLGLKVRNFTVFTGGPDTNGKNIHVDGTKMPDNKTDVILEARLSYYEMASAPGIIRWFPKTEEYVQQSYSKPGEVYANHWLLPWIQDLKQGKVGWGDVPDYIHATSTNAPSALLRTNVPHHVIQGPGIRLTISAQLIFADTGSPVGVWNYIENNYKRLGI